MLQEMIVEGWAPPRRRVRIGKPRLLWIVARCSVLADDAAGHRGRVHVVGAGLAGLSAAVALAGRGVPSCSRMPPGRPAVAAAPTIDSVLDMVIDNGNHLVLSGNHAVIATCAPIGAEDRVVGPARAEFPFFDVATGRALDAPTE